MYHSHPSSCFFFRLLPVTERSEAEFCSMDEVASKTEEEKEGVQDVK